MGLGLGVVGQGDLAVGRLRLRACRGKLGLQLDELGREIELAVRRA